MYFLLKLKSNSLDSELFSYKEQFTQTNLLYRNYFSIFVLRWNVFKLIKNPFLKLKKQLMRTNFTLVMYMIKEKC